MIALITAAFALDPSPRPELADDPCQPVGARAGTSLTLPCDGVFVPTPRAAWYAKMITWADETDQIRRLSVVACDDRAAVLEERRAWWESRAARPRIQPAVWVGVGVVGGVGLTLGAAWGLGQIAQ